MAFDPALDDVERFCQQAPERTWPRGWRVEYRREVGSTNDLAREAARRGASPGLVYVADYQTAGRGRLGRSWVAPPGSSLLFSVLWRSSDVGPFKVTMACALGAAIGVETVTGLQPSIKWPNDLMLGQRKVAGVLTEVVFGERVVIGIGVNVNYAAWPGALPPTATSLDLELGRPVPRGPLLAAVLGQIADLLETEPTDFDERVRRPWERRLWRRRQSVHVLEHQGAIEGVVEGIDVDGALLLRLADGGVRRVTSGEILP